MFKQLIAGELVEGDGKPLEVINPTTGKVLEVIPTATEEQTQKALESAQKAFESWSKKSIAEREVYIQKLVNVLDEEKEKIVSCLISETGKAADVASYDFDMLPDCLKYYNEEVKRLNGEIVPDYDNQHINMLIRKPLGVVVCHLAWNFPLLNVGYKLGPILASGCTCVIKPSSDTPLATMLVGEAVKKAGIPDGVVNIVEGSGAVVSKVMNESTIPSMVTMIGSTGTGKKLVEQSSTSIKNYSLELGGNAPVIVMKDADAFNAGVCTADGKFGNTGQVCVAPNRIFVHESVLDEFMAGVNSFMDEIKLGSGNDEGKHLVGPLVNEKALHNMESLVEDAVSKGAKIYRGGKRAEREGFFYEPTVLVNVDKTMRVYQEEIFGPIMPIYSFNDEADIVAMANDTEYGLAAYVYTKDLSMAMKLSQEIDAGSVCVNEPFYAYQLPHGGCKQSGIGKDCSRIGLEEYYTVQRISIKL